MKHSTTQVAAAVAEAAAVAAVAAVEDEYGCNGGGGVGAFNGGGSV